MCSTVVGSYSGWILSKGGCRGGWSRTSDMKAFLIPPTESDQKDTDLKAVGVKSMKIGEILNMGRESVAITGAYKSDSHHLLHTKTPLYGAFCMEQIKDRTLDDMRFPFETCPGDWRAEGEGRAKESPMPDLPEVKRGCKSRPPAP